MFHTRDDCKSCLSIATSRLLMLLGCFTALYGKGRRLLKGSGTSDGQDDSISVPDINLPH